MGLAGEPAHHLTCTTRPPQLQRGNDAGAYSEGHRATNSGLIGEPAHLLTYTHTHPNYAEAHSKGRWVTDAGLTATHLNYAGANLGGLRATDAGPIDEPTRLLSHSLCPPRLRRGDYAGAYSEGRQEINPRLVGTHSEDHKAANPGSVGAHPEGYQVTNVTKTDKTKTDTTDADLMGNYSAGHQAASSGFTGSLQSRKDTAYQWPVETDLVFRSKSGKIRLTEQNLTVRATIAFAFGHLHASIIFQHAFPDASVVTKFIRQALLDASSEIPAAKGVQVRILNDDSYFHTISTLVDLTKECSPEHESVYFVRSIVVGLIEKHLKDFNYIYPRRTNNSAWSAPANVGRPYRSLVIISVIRELYLLETSTFFVCNKHLFPHHPGNDEEPIYEVPKVMVALVATGFYAALHEWSTGERKHIDFTANMYLDVYNCHINALEKIERNCQKPFQNMMADIFRLAVSFWGIDQSIRYGPSTTILSTTAGIVDTGTTLILIATDAFNLYKSATGAVNDASTGLLRITSTQFSNLQSLFFTAGGTSFELTANAQIWPRTLNTFIGGTSGSIYLVVNDIGTPSGSGLDFINGYTFLERFYSVFDTTNNRVGFATTPFTTATTN
ncbi:hypothetical protein BJY52DRAFT_1229332 [Lactarius psammicola]|nr:hypothetical protein BJY52DRAFT_1229332 [Lactarius psammicola]